MGRPATHTLLPIPSLATHRRPVTTKMLPPSAEAPATPTTESVGNDGPLAVAVNCAWSNYNGGVFEDPNCGPAAAHAVTVVGYDDNEKFWIVKNSWGESWGDQGYIRLRKDYTAIEFGMCGIAQYAYFPLA